MIRNWLAGVGFAVGVVALVGCKAEQKPEGQARSLEVAVGEMEVSKIANAPSDDHCGLDEFPVSKSTEEILADVPKDGGRRPNHMMIAKVAISPEGKITHLRILRPAWPALPNSHKINEDAVDSVKH